MTIDQLNVENAKKMGFEEKIIYGMIIGYEHCVEVRGLKFGKSVCLVSFIDTQHKDNIQFTISIYGTISGEDDTQLISKEIDNLFKEIKELRV